MAYSISYCCAGFTMMCEIVNMEMRRKAYCKFLRYTFITQWEQRDSSELDILHQDDKKILYLIVFKITYLSLLSVELAIIPLLGMFPILQGALNNEDCIANLYFHNHRLN